MKCREVAASQGSLRRITTQGNVRENAGNTGNRVTLGSK